MISEGFLVLEARLPNIGPVDSWGNVQGTETSDLVHDSC